MGFYLAFRTMNIVSLFGNQTTRLTQQTPAFNICYSESFCHAWTHAASQRWQTYAQWLFHVGLRRSLGLEALAPITQCVAT